jgi:hypothetical protein
VGWRHPPKEPLTAKILGKGFPDILTLYRGGSSLKMVVIYWAYNGCIYFKNNNI